MTKEMSNLIDLSHNSLQDIIEDLPMINDTIDNISSLIPVLRVALRLLIYRKI